jgi:uncharacterized protein (TIGR02145 family)
MKIIFNLMLLVLIMFQFSCTDDKPNETKPIFKVTTDSVVLDISNSKNNLLSIKVYGRTDQDHSIILKTGTCYGEKPNPTLADLTSGISSWSSGNPFQLEFMVSGLKPNTVYHFRNFVQTAAGIQYGNDLTYNATGSVLFSKPVQWFKYGKVVITAIIKSDGGTPIFSSGVVWSKTKNPTIELLTRISQAPDKNNIITIDFPQLEPTTTYYARSYAINTSGVSYSEEIMFTSSVFANSIPVTDIDGNEYKTIRIGNQIWMCENLQTTKYRNGDLIGTTSPATKNISSENIPKYQWVFNGDETNLIKFGRLYTWYVVTDSRNIAPEGWRVPSLNDFDVLEKFLVDNGYNYPEHSGDYADFLGKSMASTSLWETNATTGNVGCDPIKNNVTNFNAYPVGYKTTNGSFVFFGWTTIFWSSSAYDYSNGLGRQLTAEDPDLWNCYSPKEYGCAVRCVKDASSNIKGIENRKKSTYQQSNNQGKLRTH